MHRRPITNNTLITLPGSCCRHRSDDVASDDAVDVEVGPSPSLDPCDVLLAANANKTLDHHVYTQVRSTEEIVDLKNSIQYYCFRLRAWDDGLYILYGK